MWNSWRTAGRTLLLAARTGAFCLSIQKRDSQRRLFSLINIVEDALPPQISFWKCSRILQYLPHAQARKCSLSASRPLSVCLCLSLSVSLSFSLTRTLVCAYMHTCTCMCQDGSMTHGSTAVSFDTIRSLLTLSGLFWHYSASFDTARSLLTLY